MQALYLENLTIDELKERAIKLKALQAECRLCPHECLALRSQNETGECRSIDTAEISSAGPHFGEEPPLTGTNGSGTIFFTNCNLCCEFCQNYDISQMGDGRRVNAEELAAAMLSLQNYGCHNVNFVTLTHFVPQIVEALVIGVDKHFELPLVYNCGGYESLETLRLLDGIVDIYMPDIKYGDDGAALKYSGAPNYTEHAFAALKEMHRQVGDLKLRRNGVASRGLLVRHLVMPDDTADSEKVLRFIAEEISPDTYVNVMDQYRPAYKTNDHSEINRRITRGEFDKVIALARQLGLTRGLEY